MQECPKCRQIKDMSEFYSKNSCKKCREDMLRVIRRRSYEKNREKRIAETKMYSIPYYEKNKEKLLQKGKEWREQNPERVKKYRIKNKDKLNQQMKEWVKKNHERSLEIGRKYRERNRERINAEKKLWRKTHPEEWKKELQRIIKWRKQNPNYRILDSLRVRLRTAVKEQGSKKLASTLELTSCSIQELRMHLEKSFRDGMTWNNYGDIWEIDHIKPCASFDFSKAEDQKVCFHYSNLQPLLYQENRAKGSKLIY